FNASYEEAAKDLGANDAKTFWEIVLPLLAPSLVGVGLLTFTLIGIVKPVFVLNDFARKTSIQLGLNL
ncbi:MAG: ABC transporter permease subunit, partial [Leptolyngbya sp. SIO1D8]|nr:ABC transporter permease subunit [Leptolyngbya sp. SIO1D8]